jgi:hypothetical protein
MSYMTERPYLRLYLILAVCNHGWDSRRHYWNDDMDVVNVWAVGTLPLQ